jgi:hypothetical protein
LVIFGHFWSFLVIFGHFWPFLVIFGHFWSFLVIFGHFCSFLFIFVHFCSFLAGFSWTKDGAPLEGDRVHFFSDGELVSGSHARQYSGLGSML